MLCPILTQQGGSNWILSMLNHFTQQSVKFFVRFVQFLFLVSSCMYSISACMTGMIMLYSFSMGNNWWKLSPFIFKNFNIWRINELSNYLYEFCNKNAELVLGKILPIRPGELYLLPSFETLIGREEPYTWKSTIK